MMLLWTTELSGCVDSEPWCDLESHEFLQQKFARIWNAYLADVLGALADGAFELLLGKVGLTDEATDLANVHLVVVGDVEKALFEEAGCAM